MSEWTSLLAVYWALWALDGFRVARRHSHALIRGVGRRSVRLHYDRWQWPAFLPTSWRLATADPPLSLSPLGVANIPRGSAGRPAETPSNAQVWRWEDIRQVGVANGWIYINGQPFCPDSGHVPAHKLLQLADSSPAERAIRIASLLRGWFRPTHLRRRARVLEARTRPIAIVNLVALVLGLALSVYVLADVASRLSEEHAQAVAQLLPAVLGLLLIFHFTGTILAWRAMGRWRASGSDRRTAALIGAALLPPQALKLRALLADGYFPAVHPLAAAVAFGTLEQGRKQGFQTLADLRWPMPIVPESPSAAEIATWFGRAIESHADRVLREAGVDPAALLQAPAADSPASCRYCPRCGDQFTNAPGGCPHGIALLPLSGAGRGERQE